MDTVVNRQTAERDVLAWLDFKKISKSKRLADDGVAYSDDVEKLIEAVEEGTIIIDAQDEDASFSITHKLNFPIKDDQGNPVLTEVKYKPRLQTYELTAHLKGVKATDADGRILAYKAALTNQPKGLINKMDSSTDATIASAITLFFI